ncbi:unnamed protein product [Clavelina lepadiformis]|uniref:Uncharacterized protein n=1 Tax=Clavelina lepadiformis TaxID=159417 RepID=A0ABP0EZP9_CLALP
MNTQLILALCFSLAAVICNVVALVSSAWLGTYGQTSVGLFEMCMEGKCFSMFAMHTLMGDIAKAVTALVVVAVLLLILGIFLIICACTRNDVKLTRLSSIIILLSGGSLRHMFSRRAYCMSTLPLIATFFVKFFLKIRHSCKNRVF